MKEEGLPEFCTYIKMNEDRTFETNTQHMGKIHDFWNHIFESDKCASYEGPSGNSSNYSNQVESILGLLSWAVWWKFRF